MILKMVHKFRDEDKYYTNVSFYDIVEDVNDCFRLTMENGDIVLLRVDEWYCVVIEY